MRTSHQQPPPFVWGCMGVNQVQKSRTQSRMENGYRMEILTPEGVKKGSAKEVSTNVNVIELL
jgi:hypothetical protein